MLQLFSFTDSVARRKRDGLNFVHLHAHCWFDYLKLIISIFKDLLYREAEMLLHLVLISHSHGALFPYEHRSGAYLLLEYFKSFVTINIDMCYLTALGFAFIQQNRHERQCF